MKKTKKGLTLLELVITVILMTTLASIFILSIGEINIAGQANQTVEAIRLREIQHAAAEIISDYQILEEKDASVRNLSLQEYILNILKSEYSLTEEEENAIQIDEFGHVSLIY